MCLAAAIAHFLTQLRADGRSERTVCQYRRHLRRFVSWWEAEGRRPAAEHVTHEDLARFLTSDPVVLRLDGAPKKPVTMNALRTSLRGFFEYMHKAGYVQENPARVIRGARPNPAAPSGLVPRESERLRSALATATTPAARRDEALFAFLLGTGVRVGSAIALDVEDLDLVAGEARLTSMKGGGSLRVFLPEEVSCLLRRELGDRRSGPVFTAQGNRRLSARHIQRRFEYWRERAGLPSRYSPHNLRHTFAMRLYERTGDVLLVKEALGHRSISSTMVYARASAERVRAAVLG